MKNLVEATPNDNEDLEHSPPSEEPPKRQNHLPLSIMLTASSVVAVLASGNAVFKAHSKTEQALNITIESDITNRYSECLSTKLAYDRHFILYNEVKETPNMCKAYEELSQTRKEVMNICQKVLDTHASSKDNITDIRGRQQIDMYARKAQELLDHTDLNPIEAPVYSQCSGGTNPSELPLPIVPLERKRPMTL